MAKPKLTPGDRFPELTVSSTDGDVVLRERWERGPLIVAFMRHFGCPFCREQLIQLDAAHEEIRAAGGDVVAVFQYRAQPTRNFCRQRGVDLDCLADPDRDAYDAVGLDRGSLVEYVGPQLLTGWARAARAGAGLPHFSKPSEMAQRPGTFVVGPDGRVALAHYNKDSADNPPIEDVVAAVRGAAGARA